MPFIRFIPGYRTALLDGVLVPDSPKHMASEEFYRAVPGSVLHLCGRGYLFAVAIYSLERKTEYMYSYAYQSEENWTTYTRNLKPGNDVQASNEAGGLRPSWYAQEHPVMQASNEAGGLCPSWYGVEDYVFDADCWFRVCVKREDDEDLSEEDWALAGSLVAFSGEKPSYTEQKWFTEEIERVAGEIYKAAPTNRFMKLCLLADTHYTVGGTWEDTAHNIRRVAGEVGYDAIIHLGDLTDGMVSKERTVRYVKRIAEDLEACNAPVYITPGNHDSNYFRNRSNTFTPGEMRQLYCPGSGRMDQYVGIAARLAACGNQSDESPAAVSKEPADTCDHSPDYYIDIPQYAVRMIFLSSFEDTAAIRYGYRDEQLDWLKETLQTAAAGTRFLVFSHDAPLAKLDYWSFHIRNGEQLLDVLEEYNRKEQYQVAGFFYGHTHADYVFEECSFPVISVGCAKLEYFQEKKPQGAVTWPRQADTVTQELWDSLIIDFEKQKLKLVRFGAGEDREVSFAKKPSRYRDIMIWERRERTVKVWAHRGASGHAPENTMAAFELADALGADGIELDVQLSKDGVPVIIHDEQVDRISDGTGFVRDFTLQELKRLNVNRNFPAYGRSEIPTLAEVYDWLRGTELSVNLELKNGAVAYKGLEEKVLRLAEEKDVAGRILYSSFNHRSMLRLKRLKPEARTAFLYSDGLADAAEYGARYGIYALHPSLFNAMEAGLIESCHKKGLRVHVWTVNEEKDMERLCKLGADAVITNFVEKG
ncbi:MAG: hypothetical protein HFI89_01650 [Lachnospiraceae bacterium]|nr:hypothetical protein [Lachnospiraceae bacterium]